MDPFVPSVVVICSGRARALRLYAVGPGPGDLRRSATGLGTIDVLLHLMSFTTTKLSVKQQQFLCRSHASRLELVELIPTRVSNEILAGATPPLK